MPTLRELLADNRTHVFDGAMGTVLYGKGVFLNVCYDELNLRQPGLVSEIHRAYVKAGAEVLETNTFGATPRKLAQYGLADETERINRAAAELARAGSSRSARRRWRKRAPTSPARSRGCSKAGWTDSSSRLSAMSTSSGPRSKRFAA